MPCRFPACGRCLLRLARRRSRGGSLLALRPVERLEHHDPALEQLGVVGVHAAQTFDHASDHRRFGSRLLLGLQVELMDDAREPRHRRVVDRKAADHRLERAAAALVPELDAVHVERNRGRSQLGSTLGIGEPKGGRGVDETPHQPRGRHAIDAGAWPGDPDPVVKVARRKPRFSHGWIQSMACCPPGCVRAQRSTPPPGRGPRP